MTAATVSYEKAVSVLRDTYSQYEHLSDLFKKDGLSSSDRSWVLRSLDRVDTRLDDQISFTARVFDLSFGQVWNDVISL